MRLRAWVRAEGVGAIQRLHEATGLSRQTLSALANDKSCALYPTAKLISEATKGAVSIAELCELPRKRRAAAA